MFDRIRVSTAAPVDDGLIAWVGPMALRVLMAHDSAAQVLGRLSAGSCDVVVRLEIADDELTLVGFASEQEREVYLALRAITGLGRISAIAVLGCGTPSDILRAAAAGEPEFFQQVPGIGRARAKAIMSELTRRFSGAVPAPLGVPVIEFAAARAQLESAGMDRNEAERRLAAQLAGGVQ